MRVDLDGCENLIEARGDRGRFADIDLLDQAARGPLPEYQEGETRKQRQQTVRQPRGPRAARLNRRLFRGGERIIGHVSHRLALVQWARPMSICERNSVPTAS